MDSSGLVTFNVVDDQILSGNVTITLTIVEVSPPIVAIDPVDNVASLVILDDDSEWAWTEWWISCMPQSYASV